MKCAQNHFRLVGGKKLPQGNDGCHMQQVLGSLKPPADEEQVQSLGESAAERGCTRDVNSANLYHAYYNKFQPKKKENMTESDQRD